VAPDPDDVPVEPVDPDAILRRPFPTVRRGYDPLEVQTYLMSIAAALREAQAAERAACRRAEEAEARLAALRSMDPARLTEAVGEETARILEAANTAAADIRARAQQSAARMLRQARAEAVTVTDEAQRQARETVAEAAEVRERMLRDLARRRKALRIQVEQLQAGRDRLLVSLAVVRETLDAVTAELEAVLPEARAAAEAAAARAAMVSDEQAIERALASARRTRAAPGAGAGGLRVEDTAPRPAAPAPTGPGAGAEPTREPPASEPPLPRAPDPVEGRHSSAVRVIRPRGEEGSVSAARPPASQAAPGAPAGGGDAVTAPQGPEPWCPVGDEGSPRRDASEEAAPTAAVDDHGESAGEAPVTTADRVATLFARIREEAEQGAEGPSTPAVEPSTGPAPAEETERTADEPVERVVARLLKRELTSELNELLDAVRHGVLPVPAELLPPPEGQVERYASAVAPAMAAAGIPEAGSLAAELAADIVGPLRADVTRAVEEVSRALGVHAGGPDPDRTGEQVTDALRRCYRRARRERVEAAVAGVRLGASGGSPATSIVR
jgi:cell division septum initiation protein DivIVA